jgi:hypothetical protein
VPRANQSFLGEDDSIGGGSVVDMDEDHTARPVQRAASRALNSKTKDNEIPPGIATEHEASSVGTSQTPGEIAGKKRRMPNKWG